MRKGRNERVDSKCRKKICCAFRIKKQAPANAGACFFIGLPSKLLPAARIVHDFNKNRLVGMAGQYLQKQALWMIYDQFEGLEMLARADL